jgi:hypothetical protein
LQVYNFTPAGKWQEDKGWVQQLDVGWRVDAVRDAAYAALAEVSGTSAVLRCAEAHSTAQDSTTSLACSSATLVDCAAVQEG